MLSPRSETTLRGKTGLSVVVAAVVRECTAIRARLAIRRSTFMARAVLDSPLTSPVSQTCSICGSPQLSRMLKSGCLAFFTSNKEGVALLTRFTLGLLTDSVDDI